MALNVVTPTILAGDAAQYQRYIAAYQGFAKRVQIDICDGQFVPTVTVPETGLTWPQEWQVDLHMMVVRPSEHLQAVVALHPSLVIFHAEAGEDLLPVFQALKAANIKVGVALARQSFPGSFKPYIEAADHVLIFAGDLGRQGSKADLLQMEKIPLVTAIKKDIEIGWDGGLNLKNIRAVAHAGATVLNVGSALSTSRNPAGDFEALSAEADKKGVYLG